jgi:uncharacterized OB-fold protein
MGERPINDIAYEKFLGDEKLMGSGCKECGKKFFPPRAICVKCYSNEMEWVEFKGNGRLVAFTCISVGLPFMVKEGYDRKHPYCSGVVELEEGVRTAARIEGVEGIRPDKIRIGTALSVAFLHRDEGEEKKTYLAFRSL